MPIITSKITAKGRTTIPSEVRAKLGLKSGDTVIYRKTSAGIIIRKANVLDAHFLGLQERALSDWLSPEADQAFRNV